MCICQEPTRDIHMDLYSGAAFVSTSLAHAYSVGLARAGLAGPLARLT